MYIREMIPKWTLALSILAALLHGVTMLQLVDLKVPPYTIRGQPVRLECHYDLEGEALYSVKWFKDDKEFFRFYPEDDPPAQMFRVQGVYVDLPNSSDTAVILKAVDVNGSGSYRCEVSAEAPSFKTVFNEKTMVVVDLPDASGPQIEGVRPRYQIGDTVRVNCTSSRSRPAAKLAWYINQEPADESFLRYYPIMIDEDSFQTSVLGLEFKVRQKHFKKGDLKMKCLATIDTLYWRSNEQSVEGDRPQKAPVLESRDAYSPDSSHATSLKSSPNVSLVGLLILTVIVNFLTRLPLLMMPEEKQILSLLPTSTSSSTTNKNSKEKTTTSTQSGSADNWMVIRLRLRLVLNFVRSLIASQTIEAQPSPLAIAIAQSHPPPTLILHEEEEENNFKLKFNNAHHQYHHHHHLLYCDSRIDSLSRSYANEPV